MSESKLIKWRMYGEDTPFSRWVREHEQLPSRTGTMRLGVQDADLIFHAFMTTIDGVGSRDLQTMMLVETKTRNGEPDNSQRDTLWKFHNCRRNATVDGQMIWYLGVYVLSMSGTTPDDSVLMRWGHFTEGGSLLFREIDTPMLIHLLRFERDPIRLAPQKFRRHHKTREIAKQTISELGFAMMERIVKRS